MALTTLLEIVTRACDEMGVSRPTTVYGSSNTQDRQMLGLLNAAGRDLMNIHDWTALVTTASVTLASASASYSLPTDFDRLLSDAAWDQTNHFPSIGSISPQRHQFWLSSVAQVGIQKEFRLKLQLSNNTVYIHPTPTAAATLSFLYVRNTWVASGSSNVAEFAADTDTTVFNPQLMVKELKWRWKSAKGLDSTDLMAECNTLRERLIASDVSSPMVDMAGPPDYNPIDFLNIPDGGWSIT